MRHVVMFSGGIGSWATAKRVVDEHGKSNVTLLFADVGGKHVSPHVGEDADTYRFIDDAAAQLGAELVVLNEGRDIWEVFKDNKFLGNSRLANCSKFLKQQPCREWLNANCDPEETVVYVGIDWTETHRLPAIEKSYLPYVARAPLTDPPYLSKDEMIAEAESAGLTPPSAYADGFPHANCQGACVRAGQAQWELVLRTRPETYAYAEAKEQELREYLEKDVSILRSRRGGESTPLTLRAFRENIESEPALFDDLDFGGCGCFVQDDDEGDVAE